MAERLGSAVAVMNVPVEDEHALGAKLAIANSAAIATLLKRQKPIARSGSA